jgi:hypothetical protein
MIIASDNADLMPPPRTRRIWGNRFRVRRSILHSDLRSYGGIFLKAHWLLPHPDRLETLLITLNGDAAHWRRN